MHKHFSCNSTFNPETDVIYKTSNPFAYPESRYIWFFSDPPHLLKTLRNCLFNSGKLKSNRMMCNNNLYLLWAHIANFFYQDQELGLHLLPKLTVEHVTLTSYSVMNVRLAAQVLSKTICSKLTEYGPPDEKQ